MEREREMERGERWRGERDGEGREMERREREREMERGEMRYLCLGCHGDREDCSLPTDHLSQLFFNVFVYLKCFIQRIINELCVCAWVEGLYPRQIPRAAPG